MPAPTVPLINHPYSIIVTGIGGSGVVTIGGILGMAAHLEGKGVGVIDMAGLAQKGGAVYSHIRIANRPEDIHAIRVAAGGADLVIGGDLVVAGTKKVLSAFKPGTNVVLNSFEYMPGDFTRNADFSLPLERIKRAITTAAGHDLRHVVNATKTATELLGHSIGGNMVMIGYCYQVGALPLSAEAIEKAIELNGEEVAMNLAAFRYGRRAAADPAAIKALMKPKPEAINDSLKLSRIFCRDSRPPHRFFDRLSERRLCAALPELGREDSDGGSRESAGPLRSRRSGRALSVQADGLQGRIRSRTPL